MPSRACEQSYFTLKVWFFVIALNTFVKYQLYALIRLMWTVSAFIHHLFQHNFLIYGSSFPP